VYSKVTKYNITVNLRSVLALSFVNNKNNNNNDNNNNNKKKKKKKNIHEH